MRQSASDRAWCGWACLLVLGVVLGTQRAYAATYYVATSGSGSTCALESPCATIATGLSKLAGGDHLVIHGGTYSEAIRSCCNNLPSGSSWTAATTIAAYPGETVTLQSGGIDLNYSSGGSLRYVIFDGINVNAAGFFGALYLNGPNVDHIRFQNAEMKNAGGQGLSGGQADSIEFMNLHIHNNGTDTQFDHGIYVAYTNGLIEHCDIHNNANYGIQIYHGGSGADQSSGTIIRHNKVHDNRGGMTINHGTNVSVYNNLVYNNSVAGIEFFYNIVSPTAYNNTIYNTTGVGMQMTAQSSGAVLRNNILYQNSIAVVDNGSGTSYAANLCGAAGTGCTVVGNPLFVNAATTDFHLQVGSPAIAAGVAMPGLVYTGAAPDIGALDALDGPTSGPTLPRPTRQKLPTPTHVRLLTL